MFIKIKNFNSILLVSFQVPKSNIGLITIALDSANIEHFSIKTSSTW
jgi:hypothetical protein